MAYYESVNLNLDSNCLKYNSDGQLTLSYEDEQLSYEQTMNILLGLEPGERNPATLPFLTYVTKANADGTTACTLSSYAIQEDGQYLFIAVAGGAANPNTSSALRGTFTITVGSNTYNGDNIFEENGSVTGKGFTVDLKILTLSEGDTVSAVKTGASLTNASVGIYLLKVDLNNVSPYCELLESSNTATYNNATGLIMNAPQVPSIGLYITRAQNASQEKLITVTKNGYRSVASPYDISTLSGWGIRISYFVANIYRGYQITCTSTNPAANNAAKVLILSL